MASFLYNAGKKKLVDGTIVYLSDTIKVALLDNTHVPDQDNDEFWDDVSADEISGGGYTAGGETLAGKAINIDDGNNRIEFDANDVTGWQTDTWTGARYAVIYEDTGVAATSGLIALIDSLDGSGSTVDAPITLVWDSNGAFYIGDC